MGISTSLDANGNETRSPLPRSTMAGKARRIMPLEKTFDPAAIEAKWDHEWESRGLFRPSRPAAPPFTIVTPPPNASGQLHPGQDRKEAGRGRSGDGRYISGG